MEIIDKQPCPVCKEKTLILTEENREVPHFGMCYLMSMNCPSCHYHSSDIQVEKKDNPKKYTFILENEEDLKVRVIKSGEATIKIPQLRMSVTPAPSSIGYISNIEGVLRKLKIIIEDPSGNSAIISKKVVIK